MRTLILICILISSSVTAQNKYLTKTGNLKFEASVPSFEEVAAENNSVTAILNIENGDMAALALVKGFRFKNALMEEHFNENYAESDKFPKATFKGQIADFDISNLKSSYTIKGELQFHGKSKDIECGNAQVIEHNGNISLSGTFVVQASDFDIDIPNIVSNKIAEQIEVSFLFDLQKK